MYKDSCKQLTFVIYDGIGNSVFGSMVLAPLLEMLKANRNLEITLLSFESKRLSAQTLAKLIPACDNLHMVVKYKPPFVGKRSLWFGVRQLHRLLKKIPCHEIIARGPLAGWIVKRVLGKTGNTFPCTVQARGLCAEEYRFSHIKENESWLKRSCRRWMYNHLKQIELEVYGNGSKTVSSYDVAIEAVSPALKEHLVKNFHADESKVSIATKDLLAAIDAQQVGQWKEELRKKLGIMQDAYVYCYSGSYKPWQCADQTVQFFSQLHDGHEKSFLLILSQDKDAFTRALNRYKIPKNRSLVMSVPHHELVQHLAVADAGLLFRDADVINWVSRPTKMLEYQSVGLKVIHNNTVAWLCASGGE